MSDEERRVLDEAVASLDARLRELYTLHSQGNTYTQLSEKLGLPKLEVARGLSQARRALRKELERMGVLPPPEPPPNDRPPEKPRAS